MINRVEKWEGKKELLNKYVLLFEPSGAFQGPFPTPCQLSINGRNKSWGDALHLLFLPTMKELNRIKEGLYPFFTLLTHSPTPYPLLVWDQFLLSIDLMVIDGDGLTAATKDRQAVRGNKKGREREDRPGGKGWGMREGHKHIRSAQHLRPCNPSPLFFLYFYSFYPRIFVG